MNSVILAAEGKPMSVDTVYSKVAALYGKKPGEPEKFRSEGGDGFLTPFPGNSGRTLRKRRIRTGNL